MPQGPRPDINKYLRETKSRNADDAEKLFKKLLKEAGYEERLTQEEFTAILNKYYKEESNSISKTKFTSDIFRGSATIPSLESVTLKVDDVFGEVGKILSLLRGNQVGEAFRTSAKDLKDMLMSQVAIYIQSQSALKTEINKGAGLSFEFADAYRETLTETNPLLERYGISFDRLIDASQDLIKTTGRFYRLNNETWDRAAQIGEVYTDSMEELVSMLPNFEKIGLGASNAMDTIKNVGKESIILGLRAQNVSKGIAKDLDKLNGYGFSKGVEGLGRMVQKSIEFRTSMENVFKIADKVMSPEGAIELTATLQSLGGAIGDFNDPMRLMYMATNDVEGLQDALIKSASNLATYNEEQKRFEITGVNLRYAKEMANQLGLSYKDFAQSAIASAEKASAANDLLRKGLIVDDKTQEFLTNIAQMKDGRMVVDLKNSEKLQEMFKGTEVALGELTQDQIDNLKKYQDELKEKPETEYLKDQTTILTNIERHLTSLLSSLRVQVGKTGGDAVKGLYSFTDEIVEGINKVLGTNMKATGNMKEDMNNFTQLMAETTQRITNLDFSEYFKKQGVILSEEWKDAFAKPKTKESENDGKGSSGLNYTPKPSNKITDDYNKYLDLFNTTNTSINQNLVGLYDNGKQSLSKLTGIDDTLKNMDVREMTSYKLDSQKQPIDIQGIENQIVATSLKLVNSQIIQPIVASMNQSMILESNKNMAMFTRNQIGEVKHSHTHLFKVEMPMMMDAFKTTFLKNKDLFMNIDKTESTSDYTTPYKGFS